jgi:hypothetical protein
LKTSCSYNDADGYENEKPNAAETVVEKVLRWNGSFIFSLITHINGEHNGFGNQANRNINTSCWDNIRRKYS